MNPNILIIGDIMLDHHREVKVRNIANEAPIPVYQFVSEKKSLGGCGNVLKNIHSLGCESIHLISVIGDDEQGRTIIKLVKELDAISHLTVLPSKTITKERSFCDNKLMFRCDREETIPMNELEMIEKINWVLDNHAFDCIILSDYNKGVLSDTICTHVIQLAKQKGIFTCVDPKHNIDKYKGCSLLKPNFSEACSLLKVPKCTPLLTLHQLLHKKVQCEYSVITLSEDGISLYDGKELFHKTPPMKHHIIDVTGAGDIVCAFMGYYLWKENDISLLLQKATSIATLSVEHSGTYTIQPFDLLKIELETRRVLRIEELSVIRKVFMDKTIVFTNGCFDILHPGHIQTFDFCKKQGDIVIVGMNSDESITRLKGPERPINSFEKRLKMVESIRSVDYVVLFEDDTPRELLKELLPDVLVKGGDYTIESIIGREYAKQTLICPLVPDLSSTLLINKIKNNA
jgi:D-beta-D-heptose 7-phosphate kinase/D-beta-D-heptose 1-phosphate adenosyltransferase